MVHNDDKYGEEEENLTQVRSIIKHLNEEKPAQERAREVVTRADGSKVVRVTKKRRVMMTTADVRRRNRKHVLYGVAGCFVALVIFGACLLFRMSTMSSAAYMSAQQAAMQQAWGATSVQLEGKGVEGTTLQLNTVVADFPETSVLQKVELSGVQVKLDMMSFLTGVLGGETLEIDRALIVLRNGATMMMPKQNGADMWMFRRMECKDFSVQYADPEHAPLQLKNTQAYLYYPNSSRSSSVLMFREGSVHIAGWKTVRIAEGKAHVSTNGIEDFSIRGTTDAVSDEAEQRRTSVSFAGKINNGGAMTGPFYIESDNMSLADFTDGRFEEFLTARTVSVSHGKLSDKATVSLSADGAAPVFKGEFQLKNISLSSFPALMAIREHIEPAKRRMYNPIFWHRGSACINHVDGVYSVEFPEGALVERDLASLRGRIELNRANELSGELHYGIPLVLARVEYPDGHPDPIFTANGEWAVLSTRVKGRGNMPGDDMTEVEARAVIARRERPERIPFDKLDVNLLTEQMLNREGTVEPATPATPAAPAQEVPAAAPATSPLFDSTLGNPFEESEDPFAPSTPF